MEVIKVLFSKQLFRYILVNLGDLLFSWALVSILEIGIGIPRYPSLVFTYILSQILAFFVKKVWVFQEKSKTGEYAQFWRYTCASLLLLIVNTSCVYGLWILTKLPYPINQMIANVPTTAVGFIMNKKIFKTAQSS